MRDGGFRLQLTLAERIGLGAGVGLQLPRLVKTPAGARRSRSAFAAALEYGARRLASWSDVFKEDLTPGWRAALAGASA